MAVSCSGITRSGSRCTVSVSGPQEFCHLHDPTRAEERKRAASKAGRSKPSRELIDIKQRLSDLADDVLEGKVKRGDGAVVSQILNVYLRAISVEMKAKEQQDFEVRIGELEQLLEKQGGGRRWG